MAFNPFEAVSGFVNNVWNFFTNGDKVGARVSFVGDDAASSKYLRPDGTVVENGSDNTKADVFAEIKLYQSGQVASYIQERADGSKIVLNFADSQPARKLDIDSKYFAGALLTCEYIDPDGYHKNLTYTQGHLSAYDLSDSTTGLHVVGTYANGNYSVQIYKGANPGQPIEFNGIGNIDKLVSHDGSSLVSHDGSSLVSPDGGTLVSPDGGTLITNDGGSLIGRPISSLIGNDGAGFISNNGSALLSANGNGLFTGPSLSLVASGAGNLVDQFRSGTSLVASGGGNIAGGELFRIQSLEEDNSADDFAASASTSGVIAVDSTTTGDLESVGDHDWFATNLVAGETYVIDLKGADSSDGTMLDPHLRLYSANGTLLESADQGGLGNNSKLIFTASITGQYFIEAGGYLNASSGTYTISLVAGDAAPAITTNGGDVPDPISVQENHPFASGGMGPWVDEVTVVQAYDVVDGNSGIKYSVVGGADGAAFGINPLNGILYFKDNPNYEQPGDLDGDNVYEVVVQAKDKDGLTDTQTLTVKVTDDESEPVIEGGDKLSITLYENSKYIDGGSGPWADEVTTVKANDPISGNSDITYSISGGLDATFFGINSLNGIVYFKNNPNFENPLDAFHDNLYEVTVKAQNNTTQLYDTQSIKVKVVNDGEIVFDTPVNLTVDENEDFVATLAAHDSENLGTSMTWQIVGGSDQSSFSINSSTGALSIDPKNYEDLSGDTTFEVQVKATDKYGLSGFKHFSVDVQNVNEGPEITLLDNFPSIGENDFGDKNYISRFVVYAQSIDPEDLSGSPLSIELSDDGGGRFFMDSVYSFGSYLGVYTNGQIDYETGGTYHFTLKSTDKDGISSYKTVDVAVEDLNDIPVFDKDQTTYSIAENTTAIHTFTATDADAGVDDITYALREGYYDNDMFTISANGALSFKVAPDFETPSPLSGNDYLALVDASDGIGKNSLVVAVNVTNVADTGNSNPVLDNHTGAVSVAENAGLGFATIFFGSDVDNDTLTWSLSGVDAGRFSLLSYPFDSAGRELYFKGFAPPDFENPLDVGGDNKYDVTVNLSDGKGGTASKAVTITVTDVVETVSVINGTTKGDTINATKTVTGQPLPGAIGETINGLAGNDIIDGLGGNDKVFGGIGNDMLFGNAGADTLDGEGDIDTVTYANSAAGVTVKLDGSTSTGGDAAGDKLSNVENLVGSSKNDKFTGSAAANKIEGGAGDDEINGGLGDDVLIGDIGTDTLTYASAASGVTIDLTKTTAQITGGAGKDTVSDFENITGSASGDTLAGNKANNVIKGGDGNDLLKGGLGLDTLDGGDGNDWASFDDIATGVTVDLATGQAAYNNGKIAEVDNLVSIENALGGKGNDKLSGNGFDNVIEGGLGIDELNGAGEGANGDTVSFERATAGVIVDLNMSGVQQDTKGGGKDTIQGFENLRGSAKDDVLSGDAENNIIEGGSGADTLNGRGGDDKLLGGDGVDTVNYALSGGGTIDLRVDAAQTVNFGSDGLASIENVIGSADADVIFGNAGANKLEGGAGNDRIEGGLGNDILVGGTDSDTISFAGATGSIVFDLLKTSAQETGAGKDTVSGFENILGGDFTDTLLGDKLGNKIEGGAGNDMLRGGLGSDTLMGGGDIDTASFSDIATNVSLTLVAGAGIASYLNGKATETDSISGIENLIGSAKHDTLTGDANDNVIEGGLGDDTLNGGDGVSGDTLSYAGATANVTVSLAVTTQQITGGGGKDTISNFEHLVGGKGADKLTGDVGDNAISGGAGNDNIAGGNGADILSGGLGNDTFVYATAANGGDTINDFAAGDKMQISKAGFGIAATVTLTAAGANNFGNEYLVVGTDGQASKAHGQFIVDTDYALGESALLWDADGTGGGTAELIATFANDYVLKATDFTLV